MSFRHPGSKRYICDGVIGFGLDVLKSPVELIDAGAIRLPNGRHCLP